MLTLLLVSPDAGAVTKNKRDLYGNKFPGIFEIYYHIVSKERVNGEVCYQLVR